LRAGLACAHPASLDGKGRAMTAQILHFYLTSIMEAPAHQRQGIGSQVVEALLAKVREVRYANTLIETLPLPGLEAFYARFGFRAPRQCAPGMWLWLNGES
jgi:GNAT superfamily N-acetyltransferase